MTSRLCILLAATAGIGLSLLPCAAQDGASVSLQFLSFPRSIDPEPVELVTGEGKTISVELPSNELSKTYKAPRLATWMLGETVPGEDGKPTFKVFGKARALASPRQLILVIRKGEAYTDGFDVIAIDNRVARFGEGEFLFMNAAKVDIAGGIGSEKFALKPGQHVIVEPRVPAGQRSLHASRYFRAGGKARPFFSSRWPVADYARGLIFFYHDPHSQRLRLHSIRDFL